MPTWRGTTDSNWGTASNWLADGSGSGVPTANTDATFDASSPACTITAGANCRSLICTGYANVITFTNTLTVNMTAAGGDITFSAAVGFSLAGPNGITYNNTTVTVTTRTLTTNAYNYNLPFTVTGVSVGSTLNLVGNFQVTNYTGNVNSFNFTGSELRVSGNWSGSAQGAALKVLNGTGNMATGSNAQALVINAPTFTRTFTGAITVVSTLKWTAGTVTATGSTFTLINATSVDFGGQTLNNAIFSNSIAQTLVIPTDWYLTGNLQLANGGIACNGPGKIFVAGNLTNAGTGGGSCIIEMNGTGSITGTYGNHIIISTAGIVTVGISGAISVSTFTLTAGTLNLANELQLNSGTLTITSGITFTGSSNLRITANTASITSNGVAWPTSVIMANTVNIATTITLNDPLAVTGSFTSSSAQPNAVALNGSTLSINGNLTVTKSFGGSTNIFMVGTATAAWTGAGTLGTSLTVSKTLGSGAIVNAAALWGGTGKTLLVPVNQTIVLTGGLTLSGGTFDCSAGTFNANSQTITLLNSGIVTFNLGSNNLYNLAYSGGTSSTVIMLSNIVISNNLASSGTLAFNGAFDIEVRGNITGNSFITNSTAGRKLTMKGTSTGVSSIASVSMNFHLEIDCGSSGFALTGTLASPNINYLATNSGSFTTTGSTLNYGISIPTFTLSNTVINMNGSTNSWNVLSNTTGLSRAVTLLSNVYFNTISTTSSGDAYNGPWTLHVSGSVGPMTTISGTATLKFIGSSNATWSTTTGALISISSIVFARTGGTLSIPNNFVYTGTVGIFWTDGAINHTGTLTLGTTTLSTSSAGMSWNNLTINSGATITISSPLSILGILNLAGAATFTGVSSWTCANLISTATGAFFITLQEGLTYTTTAGVSITGGVAAVGSRPTMRSSGAGYAIWTLAPGATQSMIYVNGTRIDSSQNNGQTIWSFGVTPANIATTINWNVGTRPGTVAYAFVY